MKRFRGYLQLKLGGKSGKSASQDLTDTDVANAFECFEGDLRAGHPLFSKHIEPIHALKITEVEEE